MGTSGNRAGRPAGSRNKSALFVEALLEGESAALVRKTVEMGKKGDIGALRLCLERMSPPRRERLVEFDMPKITRVEDAGAATAAILDAVANGRITPAEGELVARTVKIHTDAMHAGDLGNPVAELEEVVAKVARYVGGPAPHSHPGGPHTLPGEGVEDDPDSGSAAADLASESESEQVRWLKKRILETDPSQSQQVHLRVPFVGRDGRPAEEDRDDGPEPTEPGSSLR